MLFVYTFSVMYFWQALKPQAGTPAPDRLEMEVPRIFESIFSFHDDNDSMEAVMAALDVTADVGWRYFIRYQILIYTYHSTDRRRSIS